MEHKQSNMNGPNKGANGSGKRGHHPPLGELPNKMTMTTLGLQSTDDGDIMKKISEISGHTFEVPPVNRYHSKQAEQKFSSMAGSINPVFNSDRFDAMRQKLQTSEKKEREAGLQAIAVVYSEELSKSFAKSKDCDYAEIERMFYPNYAPEYKKAMQAFNIRKPLIWRPGSFTALENIARLPLERCSEKREAQFSFEEWYNLFWNYYTPFSPLAFTCLVTAQSMIFTKELVEGLSDYLAWRHSLIDDPVAKKAPILYVGSRIGKYGGLINATKKVPVPIIHVHDDPNTNPYLLAIPPHKQGEFKPHPVIKMPSIRAALDKYEPSIVLFSDMKAHTDETSILRGTGCVREYICIGMPDSYAEGAGWDTWGYCRYKPKDAIATPPYLNDGWGKLQLHHLSRYVIHKCDSDIQKGMGAVTTFMRRPVIPPTSVRMGNWLKRLRPFY
eukprot:Tbor_TRINITY_DN2672_c0_g1::TRINITY_DN2672_c0_g1_i1::g.17902::m.17902